MEIIKFFIDFIMHLDKHLTDLVNYFGIWSYAVLFLIIFCETGLVVTPFLPGDSLLFMLGYFASIGTFNTVTMYILLMLAAVLGDFTNYNIGKFIGNKVFEWDSKLIKREYLLKTQNFYDKHGGKTVIIAKYVPIVRTFAPFVAGIGEMKYYKFLTYDIIGGSTWVTLFFFTGFFFGGIEAIKNNFTIVIFTIIFISLMPGIIAFLKSKFGKRQEA